MMAVLDAVAADADAGREVFTDEPVARYLLGERDYWMDGMRRVAEAAAAAAPGAPLVASAFVNHVGSRGTSEVLGMYDIAPVRECRGDHPRPPRRLRPARRPRARASSTGRSPAVVPIARRGRR